MVGAGSSWTASYDAAGNMLCRSPTSAKTCAGTAPTGPLLTWDNEGRLTAWQNTSYFSSFHTGMEEALYDGEGQRVQQIDESSGTHATTQHTYVGSAGAAKTWYEATDVIYEGLDGNGKPTGEFWIGEDGGDYVTPFP